MSVHSREDLNGALSAAFPRYTPLPEQLIIIVCDYRLEAAMYFSNVARSWTARLSLSEVTSYAVISETYATSEDKDELRSFLVRNFDRVATWLRLGGVPDKQSLKAFLAEG